MPNIDERTIGGLRVQIDRDLCVGFGDCVTASPETFELDDDGIAIFREVDEVASRERVIEACDACPVDAITVIDADGVRIVP
jgi:ferredoxin